MERSNMVPKEIVHLVEEAKCEQNDGWTKDLYREKLREIVKTETSEEIKKYIESALGKG